MAKLNVVKTVTVQPGDTLWKIAEREFGNGRYYLNVYLLNAVELATSGNEIDSAHIGPDFIYPGTQLKIIDNATFTPSGN